MGPTWDWLEAKTGAEGLDAAGIGSGAGTWLGVEEMADRGLSVRRIKFRGGGRSGIIDSRPNIIG